MNSKFEEIGSLKIGSYLMMDGVPCRLNKMDKSKTGKHGHLKCRVEGIGLIDNVKRVQVMVGHSKVEVPIIEKKNAQVLSISETKAQVMDLESFETFDAVVSDEVKDKMTDGKEVVYWDIVGVKIIKQVKT